MISIYMWIAIICGVLLIITFLMGDFSGDADFDVDVDMDVDGDIGHIELGHGDFSAGISPMSLPLLLAFGTSFGSFGAILEELQFHYLVVPIVSALVSVFIAAALYMVIVKVFSQSQASSTFKLDELVGKEAVVSIPIKPGGIGQVIVVTEQRGRTTLSAVSDQEIPIDSMVTIKKTVGDGVFVTRIQV